MSSRYRPTDFGDNSENRYRRRDDFQPYNQPYNGRNNNMVDERGRRRGRMSNSLPPREPAFSSYPRRRRSRDRSNDMLTAKDKHIRARRDGFIGSPSYEPVIPYGHQQRPGYRGRPFDPNRPPRRFDNNNRNHGGGGGAPFQQNAGGRQRSNQSLTPFSERSEERKSGAGGGASPSRQRRARRSHTPLPNRKRLRLLSDSKLKRDDEDHLEYGNGDIILGRYQLLRTLGKGTFGKVAEMVDINDRQEQKFALKIIRDVDKYRRAAEAEINFLEFIGKCRPQPGKALCVIMHSYFNYHGHMCIVFEKLGISVYDFMKRNDYHPYSMSQTRHIGYQLCHAVRFLHNNRITHTDLKPENMLFTYTDYVKDRAWAPQYEGKEIRVMSHSNIRIIDFGSAIFDQEPHTSTVTTRHYRAPEVVMKLGWSKPCDVWSIACIVFELYTGITMFQTHEDREHIAMMEHILGRIPSRLIKRSKTDHFSPTTGELDWDPQCSGARYIEEHCKSLESYFKTPYNGDPQEARQLYELLRVMFDYDQDKRVDLDHAVRHEYFNRLPREHRIPLAFGSEQPSRYNTTMRELHKQRNGDSGFRSLSKDNNNNHHGGGNYQNRGRNERMPSPAASFRSRRQRSPLVPPDEYQMLTNRGGGRRTPPRGDFGMARESNLTQRSNNYQNSAAYNDDEGPRQRRRHGSNTTMQTSASSSRHAPPPRSMHQQSPTRSSRNNEQMLFNLSRSERGQRGGSGGSSRYGGPSSSVAGESAAGGRVGYKQQLPSKRGRPISPRRPPDLVGTPLHITKARAREIEQQRQHELGMRFNPPVVDQQRMNNSSSSSNRRRPAAISPPPPFPSDDAVLAPPHRSTSRSGEKQRRRSNSQRGDTVGERAASSIAVSESGAPLVNRYGEVIEYVGDQRRKKPQAVVAVDEAVMHDSNDAEDDHHRRRNDRRGSLTGETQSARMVIANNHVPSQRHADFGDDRMEQTFSSRSRRDNNGDNDKRRQPPRQSRRNGSDPGERQRKVNRRDDAGAVYTTTVGGGGRDDNVFKPPPAALTRHVQQVAAKVAERDRGNDGAHESSAQRSKPHRASRRTQLENQAEFAASPSVGGNGVHADARFALQQRGSRATKRERSPQNHAQEDDERYAGVLDNDDEHHRSGSKRYAENDDDYADDSSPPPAQRLSSQVFIRRSEDNNLDYNVNDDDDDNEDNANKYQINRSSSSRKHARYDDDDGNETRHMHDDDDAGNAEDDEQQEMIVSSSPPRATLTVDERRQRMYKRLH